MKNNFKKIVFTLIIVSVFSIFLINKIEASTLYLKSSNASPGINEQFYVDVMLTTDGKIINGLESTINFGADNLTFIRAEEGKSLINLWVEKPKLEGNSITFSGIMPNGFEGVIDPFNLNTKLPGLMIRLVFEAKKEGNIKISSNSYATLNDGKGTIDDILPAETLLSISKLVTPYVYKAKEVDVRPEIMIYVTQDPNLYDNKYVLIFEAKDKQTGIKNILVREGRRDWKEAASPYLLEDQSRSSIISLQATNYSGLTTVVSIDGLPSKTFSLKNILIIIFAFILFVVLFIIKKFYKIINFTKIYEKFK